MKENRERKWRGRKSDRGKKKAYNVTPLYWYRKIEIKKERKRRKKEKVRKNREGENGERDWLKEGRKRAW